MDGNNSDASTSAEGPNWRHWREDKSGLNICWSDVTFLVGVEKAEVRLTSSF